MVFRVLKSPLTAHSFMISFSSPWISNAFLLRHLAISSMEASALEGSLSMEQKRQLIYEVSMWPEGASEILQAWSRQEILQVLCVELGKERKYTGLTKSKLIENLLKIVCEKRLQEPGTANASEVQPSSENGERTHKRQRKSDHPNGLSVASNSTAPVILDDDSGNNTMCCKNSACKAKMNHNDVFCKRCSCCICHQYDDNKDPGLWLICNSDPPFRGLSCGMSCHLECALRHENSGISQDRQDKGLDGSFCCVSCGKVNDLLSSWRKQLIVAKDTRRVDILCYRLSLSQKILAGTKHYQHLFGIINDAVKKLEEDVGPLTGLPVKKARGIVNRLSSGPEIQRLCASALESLDVMLSNRVSDMPSGCNIRGLELVRFEDIRASSIMVILNSDDSDMGGINGYTLWHRRADDKDYPAEPTCRLFKPNTKFLLSGLASATQYILKVVALDTDELRFQTQHMVPKSKILEVERSESPVNTNCSRLSSPSSVEDETNNTVPSSNISDQSQRETTVLTGDIISLLDEDCSRAKTSCSLPESDMLMKDSNKGSLDGQMAEDTSTDNGSNTPPRAGLECAVYVDSSEAGLPITPCKFENAKDDAGRGSRPKFGGKDVKTRGERETEPQAGSSSKKRNGEMRDEKCSGIGDEDFEYYVKVIRWLEREGHIETGFRQKFLTWYSLRATPQEVRVVKAFIGTLVEDPESLAGQLIDSFSDIVSNKRCLTIPSGFCTKLWH
ncbi:VIN3-like protein 2 [Salvia splendens]|uniref:VIN3-like protein 2 n=1 Tax=Salvia splendens TaxID=180675 RepID=UPI001C27AA6D|nr:VIN3-like protein 2 [Salvia splendens]